ncbi:MAG: homocysteine S-methyltransferase family protein [Luteitalea sp.]|nr:homocysteine S-methyltransferase family protein [Acidobacteriota bacterium]
MSRYRHNLPQRRDGRLFLTDGGLETTLIFHQGIDLPDFAAFPLLERPEGQAVLLAYFETYVALAVRHQTGLVLETVTWRANPDWGARLGYDAAALADVNRRAAAMLEPVRLAHDSATTPIVVSGCVGPRGDGYTPTLVMSPSYAEAYHQPQIEALAGSSADLVTAFTLNYVDEAIGIARAARHADMPVVLSFTVETDGRLPTGTTIGEAIEAVDADTDGYPAYYMINCAHPTHFEGMLHADAPWAARIRGLRANASCRSHAELNEATELDTGNPDDLGSWYATLKQRLPQLTVLGGCCGTDHRHVDAIGTACRRLFAST